jgi:hypothetical protein
MVPFKPAWKSISWAPPAVLAAVMAARREPAPVSFMFVTMIDGTTRPSSVSSEGLTRGGGPVGFLFLPQSEDAQQGHGHFQSPLVQRIVYRQDPMPWLVRLERQDDTWSSEKMIRI